MLHRLQYDWNSNSWQLSDDYFTMQYNDSKGLRQGCRQQWSASRVALQKVWVKAIEYNKGLRKAVMRVNIKDLR